MTRLWALGVLGVACTGAGKSAERAPEAAPEVAGEPAPRESGPPGPTTLTMATEGEPVQITPVYHGTVRLNVGSRVVWIDPWSKADLEGAEKADVVVLTDVHADHLDPAAIREVEKAGTVFVAPKAVAEDPKLGDREVTHVLANGQSAQVAGMTIEAVPMYNVVRGPEEGQVFHAKGRGNGYVFTIEGRRLYVAGDTECTEEMRALEGIDHALVPMNLPYTMTPEEAAACVKAFAPATVTPIHYAGSDLDVFEKALADVETVRVARVDAYPGGLPW